MAHQQYPDEKSHLHPTYPDEPPPSYEDISRPASSILSDISTTTFQTETENSPISGLPFPRTFSFYHQFTKGKTLNFHIGTALDKPSNAVTCTHGSWGASLHYLELHQGPDAESPVIATAKYENSWMRNSIVNLPGKIDAEGKEISEQLHPRATFTHITWEFSVEVGGPDSKPHVEKFEWRGSKGKEVKDVDDSKLSRGWKLVRLGSDEGASSSSSQGERQSGFTSDGKEIVAVWVPTRMGWNQKRMGTFSFLGSGARGELGETWAIMAVATILRIWQHMDLRSSGGMSGGTAAYIATASGS